jgi:hypothetical protein
MIRYRFAATLGVLAAGVLCLGGQAQAATVTGPPALQAYYTEAVAYWGLPEPTTCRPSGGTGEQPATIEVALVASLPGGEWGRVTGCWRIEVLEGLASCYTKAVMFHEVGHLVGLGHSTDPSSLMYPTVSGIFCPPAIAPEFAAPSSPEPTMRRLRFKRGKTLNARAAHSRGR